MLALLRRYRWAIRLLGVALFAALVARLRPAAIGAALLGADPILALAGIVALEAPFLLGKAWRWHLLLGGVGVRPPARDTLLVQARAGGFAFVTPGQAGDLMRVVDLRALGHAPSRTLAPTLLDRGIDLAMTVAMGLAGLAAFDVGFGRAGRIAGAAGLFAMAAGWPLAPRAVSWLLRGGSRLVARLRERGVDDGSAQHPAPGAGAWWRATALGVALQVVALVRLWCLARAVGVPIALGDFTVVASVSTLASIVPLAPAGLGTRDLALIGVLGRFGVPAATAVAMSLLVLGAWVFHGLLGVLAWHLEWPRASS